jgi:hypothetical protein
VRSASFAAMEFKEAEITTIRAAGRPRPR